MKMIPKFVAYALVFGLAMGLIGCKDETKAEAGKAGLLAPVGPACPPGQVPRIPHLGSKDQSICGDKDKVEAENRAREKAAADGTLMNGKYKE